jgi:iron-sulfur cluster repair protein YtfE (RIC family)
MDPLTMLKKQHREVDALFKRAEKSERPDERRRIIAEIKQNLELHMRLEEEMFYPAVREVPAKAAEDTVLEAYEEHAVAKAAMERLSATDPDDETFSAKATVLHELIKHHVKEEEKEMFKLAKKLGRDELRALGEQMVGMLPQEQQRKLLPRRRAA